MRQAMWQVHAATVWIIRRLPMSAARLLFRIYRRLLRVLRPSFHAPTYFGAVLVCNTYDLIQQTILFFGVWEPDVSRVIDEGLGPGDVFIDVGANIGYDTLLASRRVGATGSVVAIEASARTFSLLQRNLELNATTNVRAVNVAVSDRVGTLDLYEVASSNIGAATTLTSRGGKVFESVKTLPLDQILTQQEIARIRLMKIDVEGAEPPILRQIVERLAHYPAQMDILVEASPQDDASWVEIFNMLIAAGFSAYSVANEYDIEWYLAWRRHTPLRRITNLPARGQDILFTRRTTIR